MAVIYFIYKDTYLNMLRHSVFKTARICSTMRYAMPARRFYNMNPCNDGTPNCTGTDTSKLFNAISDLTNKFKISLKQFPVVTVIGPQSSGKTSVIEALCGVSVFPKGMEMSTMKPFRITTINSTNLKLKIGSKEFTNEKEAKDEIERLNKNETVKEIDIHLESPDVYNSYLTDLPGLFVVADKNGKELPKKIKHITKDYLMNENSIPVVIHSAPSDPATNQAIQMVNNMNRQQDAFGVLTKIDMTGNQKNTFISEMLANKKYSLGKGYCAVVLRNDTEIDAGMTIKDKEKQEVEYMKKYPTIKPFGVDTMKRMISNIQFQKIKSNIPALVEDIDSEIKNLSTSESFFDMLTNNTANNKFATRLRIMIEKLVGSSIERCDFEEKLKESLGKSIKEHLEETLKNNKGSKSEVTLEKSSSSVNKALFAYHSVNKSNPDMYKNDDFKSLFCYGLLTPLTATEDHIRKALTNEWTLNFTLPFFDLVIDDVYGRKRLNWNKNLKAYFDSLLANDKIQNIIHKITIDSLNEYIKSDTDSDEVTIKLAQYMIDEIANEANESKMKYSVAALINIEKRPSVTLPEIARQLTQIYKEQLTFTGNLFEHYLKDNRKIRVEIYGDVWNEAYLRAVSEKLIENCYRNVAVNLLDRMVEKLIEKTVDILNQKQTEKEKSKITDKINKLNDLKSIILQYNA